MSDSVKLMKPEELIAHWRFRAHRMQLAHYECSRIYNRLHLLLGLPSIIFSTIVGTSIFATLSEGADLWIKVGAGLLSVSSAVFAALQTFLKYYELSEKNKIAGGKYANLKQSIEMIATFLPKDESELKNEMQKIEDRWDRLREASPSIPTRVWNRISKDITLQKQKEKYPNLMNYNEP